MPRKLTNGTRNCSEKTRKPNHAVNGNVFMIIHELWFRI